MFNISTKYSQNSDFRAILVNKSSNLANLRSFIDIKSANAELILNAHNKLEKYKKSGWSDKNG